MKNQIKYAFTLVELIVVITIVAILSTVGFVSYTNYLVGARDGTRMNQLASIKSAMDLISVRQKLPTGKDVIPIKYGTAIIGYQSSFDTDVYTKIRYSDGGKDPKTKEFYSYFLSKDKKYSQLLAFFEEDSKKQLQSGLIQKQSFAVTKYPYVYGENLGIFLDASGSPVQKNASIQASGSLDLSTDTKTYTSILNNDEEIVGDTKEFIGLIPNSSCKKIQEFFVSPQSGQYKINPTGIKPITVYCDMITDGGGWTILVNNDNADDEYKTDTSNMCYPKLSAYTSCGEANISEDFVLNANGIGFSELVWGVYGENFEDIKTYEYLRWNSLQTIPSTVNFSLNPADEYNIPLPGYEVLNRFACGAATSMMYIKTDVPSNTFPHNPVTTIGTSPTSGKLGFTDANPNTVTTSSYGFDDFQDGFSCGDVWTDINFRGYSSYIMVR